MDSINESRKIAFYLAENLIELRSKKKFTQQMLARVAGIPRTTLTHIESGQGNPSLTNLVKLSGALGVGVEELLSRPRSDCLHLSAKDVPVLSRSGGSVEIHGLLPDKIKGIGIEKMVFKAQAVLPGKPHLAGSKEYLTVLKGEILVHISGDKYLVKKGDVLAFPGNQPHSYRNTQNVEAIALSVVIPIPASV
ncbi:MAG: helix-turn-helix domain-containing protein [Bdellovibrionales bacterium]|nr:helix-turn-helix domain-containing protein [Bdellovibrionales bacterium]